MDKTITIIIPTYNRAHFLRLTLESIANQTYQNFEVFVIDDGSPNNEAQLVCENFEKVTIEPRIWHQWLFMMPELGRFKVYHQFRFEHRWKKSNEIAADFDFTNRYRYKLFSYIPLNKRKIENKTLFFSPSAEIFMHSGKSIVSNPFEDSRTYNGLGYVLNQNVTFFAGHMWTIGQRNSGFEYGTSHIIRLNVMVGLDLRKISNKIPPVNLGY